MVLVRGSDPITGIEVGDETVAWGTAATTFVRVFPVVSPGDQMLLERQQLARLRELGSTGALTTYDYGRGLVRGSITFQPSYNSVAFGKLLRELNGGTDTLGAANKLPSGGTPGGTPSGYATHLFYQAPFTQTTVGWESGVGRGITIRVFKSGANDTGSIDRFVGCIVTGMTWEQPENEAPRVTFNFVGKQLTTIAASGLTPAAVAANLVRIRARDFVNRPGQAVCPGISFIGASLGTNLSIRSFTLTIDGKIEAAPAFLSDPDDVQKPGHVDKWEVTGEVRSILEQTYGLPIPQLPWKDWIDGAASALRMRYVSDSNAYDGGSEANRAPFALDIWLGSMVFTAEIMGTISEAGPLPVRLNFVGKKATYSTNFAGSAPVDGQWLIQTVAQTGAF